MASLSTGNSAAEDLSQASPVPADLYREFLALRSGCAVYDMRPRARFVLTGEDRVRWLNGMITNNVRDLEPGHGIYAFLLNPQGRILADLYAFHRGDSLLVESDHAQAQTILRAFEHYIIMDDVEVSDVSDNVVSLGLSGALSPKVLKAVGLEMPDLSPLQAFELAWGDTTVTAVRWDTPARVAFELWIAPADLLPLHDALVAAGATPVGAEALELARIVDGIPRYGQDIRDHDLPQETEQIRALNFNKGCYVGQEIVERIRSRGSVHRTFTGFLVDGELPPPGAKIQYEGKDVGEVTSSALLPVNAGPAKLALGYIRREAARSGVALTAGAARLSTQPLPFPISL